MTAEHTSETPSAPPLLFGRYRVATQLGATRWAVVYAAADERLQRRVLLHLLRKELLGQAHPHERFLNEIAQMARRSHPALLEIFDSGEVGGRPFMVTEYCTGRPLHGLGLLTVEQALLYLRQLSGALTVCQAQADANMPQGLYHPPISSSNVLLVDEGQVRLVDNWLLPLDELQRDQAHYRAPELTEGQPANRSSSVYALGLLLYELLTGERPMRGHDARSIALAHLQTTPSMLRQVQPNLYLPSLEALLTRATARRPHERFPDAQSFGLALDSLWRELGAATRPLARNQINALPAATTPAPAATSKAPTARLNIPPVAAPPPRPSSKRRAPNAAPWRRQRMMSSLIAWLLMTSMLFAVVGATYFAVIGVTGITERPANPLVWISSLFSREEIYVVNIAEGLNLRRVPQAHDASNIIAVIPNGATVRKLDGPRIEDNIPWLRVRVEVDGRPVEGWMSLNYLQPR
ncbi:hypothetical protein CJ255_01300 [Candidatus Viridilinea mediisalina]|uniref:Protein kinase domain-containing protein n=1 Tax=Candidatus Viridilinea mediisalina TaxID=2024553 RepID=A0A2A6RPD1_9CHLR|nr:hypothetical protein CJ255_01300 [Candidatus Viridilinea mediisalina]